MKRRICSVLVALALCLSLMPVTLAAEDSTPIELTQAMFDTATETSSYVQTTNRSDYGYILKTGSYRLAENIAIAKTIKIEGGTLDLDGFVLQYTGANGRVIQVEDGSNVTLQDSNSSQQKHYFTRDSSTGLWMWNGDTSETEYTVTGGVITGGRFKTEAASDGSAGAGILVTGGTVTMTGGHIVGCAAGDEGGGVYVSGGSFTMTGGSIVGCRAHFGGGVAIRVGATFTMTGGIIADCTSFNESINSSGVCIWNDNNPTMYAHGGVVGGTVYNVGTITKGDNYDGKDATVFYGNITNTAATDATGTILYGVFYGTITNDGGTEPIVKHTVKFTDEATDPSTRQTAKLVGTDTLFSAPVLGKEGWHFEGWFQSEVSTPEKFPMTVAENAAELALTAKWHEIKDVNPKNHICDGCTEIVHDFTEEKQTTDAQKTAGDCQTGAVYYYSCTGCDAVQKDDTKTFIGEKDTTKHTGQADGKWETSETEHWQHYTCCPTVATLKAEHCFDDTGACTCGLVRYTIAFNPNGGDALTPNTAFTNVALASSDHTLSALPVPIRSGYTFAGWYTAAEDGDLVAEDTVYPGNTTLYAHWTPVPSGGGGSSKPSTPTITVPVSSEKGSVSVKATVKNGAASVEISDKQISQVVAEGAEQVTVDLSTLKNVESAQLPAHVLETTSQAEDVGLTVALPTGSISLDSTALESVSTGEDVAVSVRHVPATDLNEQQQAAVGDMANIGLVFDVAILVGSEKQSDFNGGTLTISVPYSPKKNEDVSKLTVWYIRDDGMIQPMGGYYDAENQCFVFETTHLSRYMIVSVEHLPSFTDVPEDAYYADAVTWAVLNGVTTGLTEHTFGPDVPCTRAQLVTFLWRAAGEPVVTGTENPFSDVTESDYFYPAVLWALENSITTGTTATTFSPEDTCTRAQAAAFLYREEQAAGGGFADAWAFPLPFTDVPAWCYEAVAWCYINEITKGTDETTFSPNLACTRAQIVTMLYRAL